MYMDVLKRCHLFQGLADTEIENALGRTPHTTRVFEKDEPVFRLMDTADHIVIVLNGRVQAQKIFPNGGQLNVSVRATGELIGPAAMFSEQRHYPCEIIALEHTEVLLIEREAVIALLRSDGQIMTNFLSVLASTTFLLQQRLELLSYNAIQQKIAFYLEMHRMRTGSLRVSIPDTMTKWALMMNVSRTSLHRELKKMEAQAIVRYDPPVIEILDSDALQEML